MYCNGAIDWSAKLVKIVPDSTCEAETAVASVAALQRKLHASYVDSYDITNVQWCPPHRL